MIRKADRTIDLNGEWKLYNRDNTIRTKATVPGQVHLDLIEAGILEDNLYVGMNYVKYMTIGEPIRAIIHDTWTLEREFEIEKDREFYFAVLDCEGLDTFATVFVNDIEIAYTENQYRRYLFDVAKVLRHGQNTIRIHFDDATRIAADKAEKYPYYVPDMFNISGAQHGFPHRNMIRKEQCSFSWDWGPAFAPCGIWRPVSLRLDQDGLLFSKWWIGTSFQEDKKMWYLLESCVQANMNMIRVWGGGRYETEEFYSLCDRLGIMVWQEFMFACALCPVDKPFLENVELEVTDQVSRLMSHPSIVLWSGNNENQEFMVKGWDKAIVMNPYLFAVDYHKLNVETIHGALSKVDKSRSYISSSPSAGMISCDPFTERYVVRDSDRGHYGDVHFYDYKHNGLLVENYPDSRFVSEYGAQSMPSFKLLGEVIPASEWHPLSALMVHRNHHGNGQQEMIEQIEYQFELPPALSKYYRAHPRLSLTLPEKNRGVLVDTFCYLTQCAQARSIAAQTEHYRRGNGLPIHTMGALYWQLNDIWPGPTWSSIEHNGTWKPLHYYMRNAFQDIVVTGFQPPKSQEVHIHVSVCGLGAVSGSLKYTSLDLVSGELSDSRPVQFSIPGQNSKQVAVIADLRSKGGKDPWFILFAEAELDVVSGANSGPSIVRMLPQIYPVERPFPLSLLKQDPILVAEDFILTEKDQYAYEIRFIVKATAATAGFVFLQWGAKDIQGWFSDNGFWLLKGDTKKIMFFGHKDYAHGTPALTTANLELRSLSEVVRVADLAKSAEYDP
ncbi:hypothetical protein BGZ92_007357 [Podila epicladia]|nr:hypothetical protein BGZ92_007357 [Podila epicladia]